MSNTTAGITVPMTAAKAYSAEEQGHVFKSVEGIALRGKFRHQRRVTNFTVHYYDETTTTRREFEGPLVKGEYAFLVPQSAVISAEPRDHVLTAEIKDGDTITINGRTFEIRDDVALNDPRLVRV